MNVCVCVRACVFLRAYVRLCVSVCVGARARAQRLCSLTYPACHSQAPYSLRSLWLHQIYRRYLIKGTNFGGKSYRT